jgi:hypothetical protein
MIQTVILLTVAIVGAATLAYLLRGSMEQPANLLELLERMEPVNAASLRHLACGVDDSFLRETLPSSQYRRLRRLRLRAILAYYYTAFRNSAVLISYGFMLEKSGLEELKLFGEQLGSSAVQLRFALLGGMIAVALCYVAPLQLPYWRPISDLYETIGANLKGFCEAHAPDLQFAVVEHFSL